MSTQPPVIRRAAAAGRPDKPSFVAKGEAMTAEPESTVGRALAYASHGWPVFPCLPGAKEPATRHGFRDATTDPDQIMSWWKRHPAPAPAPPAPPPPAPPRAAPPAPP